MPVRWRLAGGSAALTFIILAGFAAMVGFVTTNQLRGQFNDQVEAAADQLSTQIRPLSWLPDGSLGCNKNVSLSDYVATEHAQIRIFSDTGTLICNQDQVRIKGQNPPSERPNFAAPRQAGVTQALGYRIAVPGRVYTQPRGTGYVWLMYAVPLSDLDHTLARVNLFLFLGVIGGTVLALVAGLFTAQRAIRPIVELTGAAREIERTRDPSRHVPLPQADDEVAELARTLEGMLQSLDAARSGAEAMLERQREFIADASHELRTPLTSVLASLELLAEELEGEQAETAQAALRSARRMRRLVGDLLLLARADARRMLPHRPTELDEVVMEAAAEIGTVDDEHELQVEARPVVISGARDELHRMVLNLIENAVKHTPSGTHIRVSTSTEDGAAVLVVEDDGPGVPPELGTRVFERFVRGGRDGARGSGLGLSIVHSVAESHGGTVTLESSARSDGARFVVRLPLAHASEFEPPQTSTTTGSTIGRRRSLS